MTAKMIRFDDEYEDKLNQFIEQNKGHIQIVEDENLKLDPFFYERKASLEKTLKSVEDGTMKMYSQDDFDVIMDSFMNDLEKKYENN